MYLMQFSFEIIYPEEGVILLSAIFLSHQMTCFPGSTDRNLLPNEAFYRAH